jgi:pimeloyl-ACP methyl ester carboxylesterase
MLRLAGPVAVALSVAFAASASAASNPTTVTKVRTGPSGTAFYTPPSPLPGKQHGDLIWVRTLTGAAVAAGASSTKVVLYRSRGIDGKADAVSGIVSIPKGKVPKNGWPVITYAHGTTGVADQCAPSRDVVGTPVHPYNDYVLPLVTRWLKTGYAVVRTDYEGLGTAGVHPYLIGSSEGRATLDIARAARQLDPRVSKTTIISGHSQGGHAALYAAALAPTWTPDLRVRGTVAFAPASHLDDQIPLTTALTQPGGGLSGEIALIGRGIVTANPTFDLPSVLGDQANALFGQTLTQCLPELSTPDSFGGLPPKAIFQDGADFGPLAKLLDAQDPSHLKITTPLLIDQGSADSTVIPIFTDQLATELTKNGNKGLTYKKYPVVDHAGIVAAAAKDATAWIAKRLK